MLFTFFLAYLDRKTPILYVILWTYHLNHQWKEKLEIKKACCKVTTKINSVFCSLYISSALVKHQAVVSKEELQDRGTTKKEEPAVIQLREYLKHSGSLTSKKTAVYLDVLHCKEMNLFRSTFSFLMRFPTLYWSGQSFKNRGLVLPFQPLSMTFKDINYYVDMPLVHTSNSSSQSFLCIILSLKTQINVTSGTEATRHGRRPIAVIG